MDMDQKASTNFTLRTKSKSTSRFEDTQRVLVSYFGIEQVDLVINLLETNHVSTRI